MEDQAQSVDRKRADAYIMVRLPSEDRARYARAAKQGGFLKLAPFVRYLLEQATHQAA